MASENERFSGLRRVYATRSALLEDINRVSPWHVLYREETWARMSSHLRPEHRIVLDAGGGTGIFSRALANFGKTAVCYDVLREMLDVAQQLHIPSSTSGRLLAVQGTLESMPFADASFDFVVSTQTLNFVPSLAPVFAEVHRVLKKGGVFFADIDTAYRWAVIQALNGHLANATSIFSENRDVEETIVGVKYYFQSLTNIRDDAEFAQLHIDDVWGVGWLAPLIHVFAQSADFLRPEVLPHDAQRFMTKESLSQLRELEQHMARRYSVETAGWIQFCARK